MDDRTREYLRGRFGDHYRRLTERGALDPPPAANEREWGYIPWTAGGTTMVRHESWLDVAGGGSLGDFLARERPRHVYFSAGRYDDPGADRMADKGWRESDLVFDLDADHLPGVDPESDTYGGMLAACKDALVRLLDLLERDFGFEDLTVVFSGGRGYHVHVRDPAVRPLDRAQRREIVDYVRGPDGEEFGAVVDREAVGGDVGRSTPAERRTLPSGGWSGRVHDALMELVDEVRAMNDETAVARLREFEGIGEGKASAALRATRENYEELAAGNVDVHPAVLSLAKQLFPRTVARESAPIDEPVTTDINRLIRLPGSLHGGSALSVTHIERDAVDDFDPLVDAVPETFRDHDIAVRTREEVSVALGGDSFTLPEGDHSVPEHVGAFLMARGRAEKAKE